MQAFRLTQARNIEACRAALAGGLTRGGRYNRSERERGCGDAARCVSLVPEWQWEIIHDEL